MNRKVLPQSLLIVVVILVASLATYFIVYRPLNQQLKHQTYENYRIISSQKESLLEQFIERSKEGANIRIIMTGSSTSRNWPTSRSPFIKTGSVL